MGALSDGSRRRIEQIYREQRPKLWRALIGYTADPDLSSDAVAEAFAQLLATRDVVANPEAWVWRASFRIAAGELKRQRRPIPTPLDPTYEMPEPTANLVAALAAISPNQRLAVLLHDYADRSTEEIATTLGMARATVHVHLSQGRRRLRALLEAEDEERDGPAEEP